jgi:hypothetical protein
MYVNIFSVTMPSNISKIAMKELSKEFGENIPKSLPLEDGFLHFTTHIFCVDTNVNIEDICEKYNYEMDKPFKIEIEDYMYNNNYTLQIQISYKKKVIEYYLELE